MNRLPILLMFGVLWLAVFAQTQFGVLHHWLAVPLSIIPALLVYAALTHGLVLTTAFSVVAGLWLDAISSSRLGVSILPMFLFAFFVQTRSHLILRDQRFAQFWLGAAGGVLIPLVTAGLLQLGQRQPAFTSGTWWQLLVLGSFNGSLCPFFFQFFDKLNRAFNYQPLETAENRSYRPDRQMVRGRN